MIVLLSLPRLLHFLLGIILSYSFNSGIDPASVGTCQKVVDVSSLVAYVGFFNHSFRSLARKLWMYSVQVEKAHMNVYACIGCSRIYVSRRSLRGSYSEKLAIWEFRTGKCEL